MGLPAVAPRRSSKRSAAAPGARAKTGSSRTSSKTATAAPTRAQRNQRALADARAAAARADGAPASARAATRASATSTSARAATRAAAAPARAATRAAAAPATTRPAPARRKSGRAAPATRKPAASPVARVLNSRGMPLIDRILRGPVWVVMLGVLLAGIVFLNVSVLELNRGIARTDAQAATLERTNSGLRERVAKLDNGERIQQLAAARGFVMPQPGDVNYIRPRASDGKLAVERMTSPSSTAATQTGYTTPGSGTAGTAAGGATGTSAGAAGTAAGGTASTPSAAPTTATTQTASAPVTPQTAPTTATPVP